MRILHLIGLFAILIGSAGGARALGAGADAAATRAATARSLFAEKNLLAWCIVPFDSRRRGPEERAEMLRRLGFTHFAYDWRAEHVPTFDEEIETLQRWGISLEAFWFPAGLNDDAKKILTCLEKHHIKTQLWVTMDLGAIECNDKEQARRIDQAIGILKPIAQAAAKIGCSVGLYNHGGWFGEPENEIAIIKRLNADGITNLGIVYNQHHGHSQVSRFPQLLKQMMPYLYAINLNGMVTDGLKAGKQIWPLGHGDLDLQLLRIICDSGYRGPIGILGHTMDDAEDTLRDNLDGLAWLVPQLDGEPATEPPPRTRRGSLKSGIGEPSLSTSFGMALRGGMVLDGKDTYRQPPLTAECRARVANVATFNILLASDTKSSGAHWELFTWPNSGALTAYLPGAEPDHIHSDKRICDNVWHAIALQYEPNRVRLYVDGHRVADQAIKLRGTPPSPGGFAIGRLVEGGIGCDGLIDDVRISRGVRDIAAPSATPLSRDETTIDLWNFDDLTTAAHSDAWAVEDPKRRAELPEYQTIPAARDDELTPELTSPLSLPGANWSRSHGDAAGTRYSTLHQIDKTNVSKLKRAWIYHSKDGEGNIQSNPVIVDGVMYAPTVGENVVAINAVNGKEIWRFKPGGRPAHRGLTYWKGDATHRARLFVSAGEALWVIDPISGKPIEDFGDKGRAPAAQAVVAGAVYRNVFVLPGFGRDVFGYDVATGKLIWTFHTIPQPGEYGADTWKNLENGANCWGGMALDEMRGIAYIATGSPKPDFIGVNHQGSNLFANCVIALDALTGKRVWHFQEVRHDIWDLDIPAPPNLTTIERNGRRIDVVAQTTKLGNTLVLDRVTGKPLFPFRLRRAPASKLPGERTWPYQPDVQLPEPFSRQTFTLSDVTTRTPEAHDYVMGRLAGVSIGWFEPFEEGKPTVLSHLHGGAEWTGAAVNPTNGRLYVSSNELQWLISVFQPDERPRDPNLPPTLGQTLFEKNCASCHGVDRIGVGMAPPIQGLARRFNDDQVRQLLKTGRNNMPVASPMTESETKALLDFLFQRDLPPLREPLPLPTVPHYTTNGYPKLLDQENYPASNALWGSLNCLDLNTGKILWKVPLGQYPDLVEDGLSDTGAENFGGPIATAGGLVFCAGAADLKIRAFDADTGAELWQHKLPWGGYAPPATYEAAGRQFVVIPATGGGKLGGPMGDAYVAFALPADEGTPR